MTITGGRYIQCREGVIFQPILGVFIAKMVLIVVLRFLSPVLANDYLYGRGTPQRINLQLKSDHQGLNFPFWLPQGVAFHLLQNRLLL